MFPITQGGKICSCEPEKIQICSTGAVEIYDFGHRGRQTDCLLMFRQFLGILLLDHFVAAF